MAAVAQDGSALAYASEELKGDKEVVSIELRIIFFLNLRVYMT